MQSIAQQTLRKTRNTEQFVASFSGRIQALARVHTMLSEMTWQGADLRALIHDQVLLGPIDETRVTAWGPTVMLDPQLALHLAMVVHELGTNSCKYGALSSPAGWVTASWTVDGRQLRLSWVERGGPVVAAPKRQGFGTLFIEQSVKTHQGERKDALGSGGRDLDDISAVGSVRCGGASSMLPRKWKGVRPCDPGQRP